MLAEGNIAGWNSPFRQTAVSVSTSKQERMMKKKIGFIDLFIDEWHANHYPDWFRKARRAEEFELGLAWECAPFENRRPLEAWCLNAHSCVPGEAENGGGSVRSFAHICF